jgi:hypothetical protein
MPLREHVGQFLHRGTSANTQGKAATTVIDNANLHINLDADIICVRPSLPLSPPNPRQTQLMFLHYSTQRPLLRQ